MKHLILLGICFLGQLYCADDSLQIAKAAYLKKNPVNKNLKFSATLSQKRCGRFLNEEVRSVTWTSPTAVVIEADVYPDCSIDEVIGDARVEKNSLILKYTGFYDDQFACGGCKIQMRYEINNLPKKTYKIRIEEKKWVQY